MEKRKNSLSALQICRFCLGQDETLASIYDRNKKSKSGIPLPLKILSCLSVEVYPSDKMPTFICQRCRFFMELFHDYKELCRNADERIMQYIHNGTNVETLNWPNRLLKVYGPATKKRSVMKTVTEGGATVQVTSQDISDSEDEDAENVYNIKIGDSPEGKCIKVVTANKNDDKEKCRSPKEFSSVTKLTRHLRTHAGGRLFPCKYCDKSFLRSHHHTRHVRLSHREELRSSRAAGQPDQFRCEQCDQCFQSQDELIYHSAIHATQNLTCPLCQEKFDDVDAVTAHIKSHVNGIEFMCDLCELVFTSKEKLDTHLTLAHAEELENEESMEDIDAEEEDDDTGINLKEVDGQMVVEIKKAGGFMLPETPVNQEEKPDNTTASEESGEEATYTELSTVDTLAIVRKEAAAKEELELAAAAPATPALEATITPILTPAAAKPQETAESIRDSQTASILRKAEEVKRKVQQIGVSPSRELGEKKEKIARVESSNLGASDKTLRLLEKELQELKRTNSRNEASKAPIRNTETIRNRRPQLHTSTPKTRAESEKKFLASAKSMSFEKKALERKVVTKENKEPKEVKEVKNSTPVREEKEKKEEKETPKSGIKNGANDKNTSEENVRRSTRPSKIKDYAKMIRDKSQDSDEDSDNDDEEYREIEKPEAKGKSRRSSLKPASKPAPAPAPAAPAPAPAPRKRGRPRKDAAKDVPAKIMKEETVEDEQENDNEEVEKNTTTVTRKSAQAVEKEKDSENVESPLPTPVPIRALPPGIKPLPLPVNARPMGAGELCEMQIGKKVVKVQKIVMTKAEVEAMAKKGLVEMKDGTMVLKQGIKIPTSDALSLKSTLVGDKEASKESPSKTDKPSIAQSNTSE